MRTKFDISTKYDKTLRNKIEKKTLVKKDSKQIKINQKNEGHN
jgi:hypothetical protein